jgi:hypothetical protein
MINANYFNYDIGGHPKGHLIDILGVYFAIFSPFVFIYFIYVLIKSFKKPSLLWFISTWGLLFSILLSFRQKIKIDDFAPYVIVAIVFMVAVFFSDYRVRLKIFRTSYKFMFSLLFGSLILFDVFILSSKLLNIKIINQFKFSKEVSLFLKSKNIDEINCNSKNFCRKLYFYGIHKGDKYFLNFDKNRQKVSISHNQKEIFNFYVSKLNKK